MTKSNILFGIGAAILSVAGIAATKATTRTTGIFWQESKSPAVCATTTTDCSGTGVTCTQPETGNLHATIFSVSTNGTCSSKLQKN